jgi:hypothetical protein
MKLVPDSFARLTRGAWGSSVRLLQGSQPAVSDGERRRLRVLRGSAADPSNLIQVMLAKGSSFIIPSECRRWNERHL